MLAVSVMGLDGGITIGAVQGLDLGRGAIVGALIVAAAFLAGLAVFRRGSAAVFALLMISAAGALQLAWLGFLKVPSRETLVLLQGLFAASAIIFLSAVIRSARNNALLGGLMFAAALTFVGLGVINFVVRGDASGLMRGGLVGVGVFAVVLAATQARRDHGARLILPGAILALSAPIVAIAFGGGNATFSFLAHALFTGGVLVSSLVALAESGAPRNQDLGLHACGSASLQNVASHDPSVPSHEEALRVSENQLAQVLDYAGVAVWDWCPHGAHQTEGLPTLMGADSRAVFSPDAMRNFIHKDDHSKFDKHVMATLDGDGPFDVVLKLHDGRSVRLRGARAVDAGGALERMIGFVESASEPLKSARASASTPTKEQDVALASPLAGVFASALEKGDITTVFQPIVALDTGKIAGFETLARWRGEKENEVRAGAEDLVRAAEASGKGGDLARHVLRAAASHLSAQMKALNNRNLFVAMNLSVSQIRDPGFAEALRKVIAEYGLRAESIVLELTESQAILDESSARDTFRTLKKAGAALAFDDFGAGFSSLSNLQKFEFDYLKIDKSFIDALTRNGDGAKIARAVAGLGRDLGLTVIAEGVESKEIAEAARAIGCDLGQGFAFGEPLIEEPTPHGEAAKPHRRRMMR